MLQTVQKEQQDQLFMVQTVQNEQQDQLFMVQTEQKEQQEQLFRVRTVQEGSGSISSSRDRQFRNEISSMNSLGDKLCRNEMFRSALQRKDGSGRNWLNDLLMQSTVQDGTG
jgi:hypothetical protein